MRALIVDIETTTADRHTAGIVEIGACWYADHDDPLHDAFSVECLPYVGAPIDPKSLEINGCNWLHSPGHPTEAEALLNFAMFIDRSSGGAREIMMMGWNVAIFDWLVLERAWKHHLTTPFPFSFRTMDLHSMAVADLTKRGIHVPAEGIKSRLCCEAYGLEPEDKPHRAMGGVAFEYALAKLLLEP